MRERRIAVIGHPLAAEENRLAFGGWRSQVDLILPAHWHSRSLGHVYHAPRQYPGGPGRPSLHPLPVLGSGRNSLFMWIGLRALLRRLRPDAIYCWEEPWCLATRQVALAARELGIPFLFYTAENRPKRLPWPFTRLLLASFSAARACIAPTQEIAARIREWGFAGTVFVVPLWIRARRPLSSEAAGRTLAYVGRLIPLKRVDVLVEAIALLPGYRLRIIGDGPERERLIALALGLGVLPRVDFRGHVDNDGLEDELSGASLLILPTGENSRQAEQFGKAAIEGVSCGLPVLASRTGNLAALAEDFPTLAARDLDTPAQMAEAVAAIFRAYPAPEALESARLKAHAQYGPAAAARGLQSAVAGVLGDPVP